MPLSDVLLVNVKMLTLSELNFLSGKVRCCVREPFTCACAASCGSCSFDVCQGCSRDSIDARPALRLRGINAACDEAPSLTSPSTRLLTCWWQGAEGRDQLAAAFQGSQRSVSSLQRLAVV